METKKISVLLVYLFLSFSCFGNNIDSSKFSLIINWNYQQNTLSEFSRVFGNPSIGLEIDHKNFLHQIQLNNLYYQKIIIPDSINGVFRKRNIYATFGLEYQLSYHFFKNKHYRFLNPMLGGYISEEIAIGNILPAYKDSDNTFKDRKSVV